MFGVGSAGFADATSFYYLKSTLILGIIAAVSASPVVYKHFSRLLNAKEGYKQAISIAVYIGIFMICVAHLVNATYNPFLYFRF